MTTKHLYPIALGLFRRLLRIRRGRRKSSSLPAVVWTGAWLSLVERLLWEQDVGGSNPLAPTIAAGRSRLGGFWLGRRFWNQGVVGAMALARIFRPAKTAMQSGRAKTHKWV